QRRDFAVARRLLSALRCNPGETRRRQTSMRRAIGALGFVAAAAAAAARADVVIPSSVYADGKNAALFVSDVRLFNPTDAPVLATPIFYDQTNGGAALEKPAVTIPPRVQVAYDNVLQSLFGLGKGHFGPIRFQTSAPLVVSSSVNNLDAATALGAGTLVHLAASASATEGYRTNLDFVNVGDGPATVAVKIHKGDG